MTLPDYSFIEKIALKQDLDNSGHNPQELYTRWLMGDSGDVETLFLIV